MSSVSLSEPTPAILPRRAVPPRNGKEGVFVLQYAIFGILVRSSVIEVLFAKDRWKKRIIAVGRQEIK